jgi:hypothetical protein
MPRSAVVVFFLSPHNRLCVPVLVECGFHLCPGEWMQLLFSHGGHILNSCRFSVLLDRRIYLTGTDNNRLNGFWVVEGVAVLGVYDDRLEG